jgi:hypothetical protein
MSDRNQDDALEQAFVDGTLPEEYRRAAEGDRVNASIEASRAAGETVPVELSRAELDALNQKEGVSDALVTQTLAVLGRRGAVAEREVREVLAAAGLAAPLAEGAAPDLRFAHERVITPDGTHEYFTASGEKIDPSNVVLPSGALPPVAAPVVVEP